MSKFYEPFGDEYRLPPMVGVIGPGEADVTEEEYNDSYLIGRALAGAGLTVCCGGLGGVMQGVAQGVASVGGVSVGLLPGIDPRVANRYITVPILSCGNGESRDEMIIASIRAVIAVGVNPGTAIEALLASPAKHNKRGFGVRYNSIMSGDKKLDAIEPIHDEGDKRAWQIAVDEVTALLGKSTT